MRTDKVILHRKIKQNFIIERLEKLGVRKSQDGKSIYDLNYDELKYELVLASFKEIDIENENNAWW